MLKEIVEKLKEEIFSILGSKVFECKIFVLSMYFFIKYDIFKLKFKFKLMCNILVGCVYNKIFI